MAGAAAADARRGPALACPQDEIQVGPGSLEGGRGAHHNGCRERYGQSKQEHADVDSDAIDIWEISSKRAKEPNAGESQNHAERPAR